MDVVPSNRCKQPAIISLFVQVRALTLRCPIIVGVFYSLTPSLLYRLRCGPSVGTILLLTAGVPLISTIFGNLQTNAAFALTYFTIGFTFSTASTCWMLRASGGLKLLLPIFERFG